jgi:hypothetical protein
MLGRKSLGGRSQQLPNCCVCLPTRVNFTHTHFTTKAHTSVAPPPTPPRHRAARVLGPMEILPVNLLAHILSLVPRTPKEETLGGLDYFFLPGPGSGSGSDPEARSSPTPRLATPAGARELAALSLTCKAVSCTLVVSFSRSQNLKTLVTGGGADLQPGWCLLMHRRRLWSLTHTRGGDLQPCASLCTRTHLSHTTIRSTAWCHPMQRRSVSPSRGAGRKPAGATSYKWKRLSRSPPRS